MEVKKVEKPVLVAPISKYIRPKPKLGRPSKAFKEGPVVSDKIPKPIIRAKGEYSNKSPFGIWEQLAKEQLKRSG